MVNNIVNKRKGKNNNDNNLSSNINLGSKKLNNKNDNIIQNKNQQNNINSRILENTNSKKNSSKKNKLSNKNKIDISYNDYELNSFDYKTAELLDKRTFGEYFLSLLKT